MRRKSPWRLVAAALAAGAAAAGAETGYPEYTPGPRLSGEFHTMGSPTMDTITLGWLELFRQAHPEIEDVSTMEARNNNTVAAGLAGGLCQVGPASRTLFPSEIAVFVKKFGYEPTLVRVCGGAFDRVGYSPALAVYVNQENPLTQIALAQIEGLYAENGGIATWGQLGLAGEWSDKPVHLYGLNLPNGIATFFQEAAMHGREFRAGISIRATTGGVRALSGMVLAVAGDRYGLCYAGPGNAKPGAKTLPVSPGGGAPAVPLTRATVLDRSYPLSRYLYIYINRPPGLPLDPKTLEFLRIVLSRQGQEVVIEHRLLLPLPPQVAWDELAKLSQDFHR